MKRREKRKEFSIKKIKKTHNFPVLCEVGFMQQLEKLKRE
jgi:hypothetical protein